jgi:hypothetical protein
MRSMMHGRLVNPMKAYRNLLVYAAHHRLPTLAKTDLSNVWVGAPSHFPRAIIVQHQGPHANGPHSYSSKAHHQHYGLYN